MKSKKGHSTANSCIVKLIDSPWRPEGGCQLQLTEQLGVGSMLQYYELAHCQPDRGLQSLM